MKKITKRIKKSAPVPAKAKQKKTIFHLPFWLLVAIVCLPFFIIINIIIAVCKWQIFNPTKIAKTNWRKATFSSLCQEYSPIPKKTHLPFKKIHDGIYNFLCRFVP